eukprot:Em0016g761a
MYGARDSFPIPLYIISASKETATNGDRSSFNTRFVDTSSENCEMMSIALNNDFDNRKPLEREWANRHFNTLQGKEHLFSICVANHEAQSTCYGKLRALKAGWSLRTSLIQKRFSTLRKQT